MSANLIKNQVFYKYIYQKYYRHWRIRRKGRRKSWRDWCRSRKRRKI